MFFLVSKNQLLHLWPRPEKDTFHRESRKYKKTCSPPLAALVFNRKKKNKRERELGVVIPLHRRCR
jgi:hypothetical protein